jgi:hypothetical protein
MSVAGLVDYADAMMTLYLSHTHSPAFSWFFETLYPWNSALKNATVALGLVQALPHGGRPQVRVSNERQGPSPLPHEIVAPCTRDLPAPSGLERVR